MPHHRARRSSVHRTVREARELADLTDQAFDSEPSSDGTEDMPSRTGAAQPQVMSSSDEVQKGSYRGVRLTSDNYTSWQYSMRTYLKGVKLWTYVISADAPEDDSRNKCLGQHRHEPNQ